MTPPDPCMAARERIVQDHYGCTEAERAEMAAAFQADRGAWAACISALYGEIQDAHAIPPS